MTRRDTSVEDAGQPELPALEDLMPAAAPQGTQLSASETIHPRDHPGGISHAWRALRAPNFRLFFSGQSISLIGTWLTRIATSWLVYRLTGSELLLGVVGFSKQVPMLILAPFAGVLVDRWNRHRILVVTQILSALQSLALAVLTLRGIINVPE